MTFSGQKKWGLSSELPHVDLSKLCISSGNKRCSSWDSSRARLSVLLELCNSLIHQGHCHPPAFGVHISSGFYSKLLVAPWSALGFLAVAWTQEMRSSSLQPGDAKKGQLWTHGLLLMENHLIKNFPAGDGQMVL